MEKAVLKVGGMSCSHCVNTIKKSVGALNGVSSVAVDLEGKTATVEYDASFTALDKIKRVIEEQGYRVV